MLSNKERESLIIQQYWFILATVLVAILHYFILGFPRVSSLVPPVFREPMYNTYVFFVEKINWLFNPWYIFLILVVGLTFYGLGAKGVRSTTISPTQVRNSLILGFLILLACTGLLWFRPQLFASNGWLGSYTLVHFLGQMVLARGATQYGRLLKSPLQKDLFNDINESFPQEERTFDTEYSINIPTKYRYQDSYRYGMINLVNPFRGVLVSGLPGSGKTFSVLIPALEQSIKKGFTAMVYDIKFPDMSKVALQSLMSHHANYKVPPKFYVIYFDDVALSHRCNPLLPEMMNDVLDAYEIAKTIMLNLNRKWIEQQGEFFVESAINFVTAVIWVLKRIDDRRKEAHRIAYARWQQSDQSTPPPITPPTVCTFPHVIEFANRPYKKVFPILLNYPEVENFARMFADALSNGTMEQLDGQIASARNGMARLSSPTLYWVMTGNDFTLDINNPEDPKIVCIGNNPKRQNIYGAALSLYTSRIMPLINQKGKVKCALFIDELPTMFLMGLDQLLGTGRSNLIAVYMGIQDFAQLIRDYGEKAAKVIIGMPGNFFSGQVVGENAEQLSKRFGKTNQMKVSITETRNDTTVQRSEQMQEVIPASKISALSQGWMVGGLADDMTAQLPIKMFHAKLLVEPSQTPPPKMPVIYDFEAIRQATPGEENTSPEDFKTKFLYGQMLRVKEETDAMISLEVERLPADLRTAFKI